MALPQWRTDLLQRHCSGLTLCRSVADIAPQSEGPTNWGIRENFAEKFGGSFLVPSEKQAELAFGRIFEDFVAALPSA